MATSACGAPGLMVSSVYFATSVAFLLTPSVPRVRGLFLPLYVLIRSSSKVSTLIASISALGFAFVERLLEAPERDIAVAEALSKIDYLKDFAVSQGSDGEMLEEFISPFTDLIIRVAKFPPLTHRELVDTFNDMYRTCLLLIWCCILTS